MTSVTPLWYLREAINRLSSITNKQTCITLYNLVNNSEHEKYFSDETMVLLQNIGKEKTLNYVDPDKKVYGTATYRNNIRIVFVRLTTVHFGLFFELSTKEVSLIDIVYFGHPHWKTLVDVVKDVRKQRGLTE